MHKVYCRKKEPIEAIQYTGDNLQEIFDFVNHSVCYENKKLYVKNVSRKILVEPTDFIIASKNDMYDVVDQSQFEEWYEEL